VGSATWRSGQSTTGTTPGRPFRNAGGGYRAGMSSQQPTGDHDPATEPTTDDATAQGAEASGTPVDPAMATSSPDPEQTGRGQRAD
jgi:hypothetical protein